MLLLLKGIIVGLGKIIPGVSGAMLAIYFNVYEKALNAITNFFDDWKNNLKFIFIFGLGVFIAIILGSKLILYLFNNHYFLTMMLFIGLIFGGTYDFSKQINYNNKNISLLFIIIIIFSLILFGNFNYNYNLNKNFTDNIVLFFGGFVDIFASIVPGISGTSLLMIMGIYNIILTMTTELYNFNYLTSHLNLYLSYGIGMLFSFIISAYLMNYLLKKYKNTTYIIILGLSITSIIFLIIMTFKTKFTIIEFILGIMVFVLGLLISCIMDK